MQTAVASEAYATDGAICILSKDAVATLELKSLIGQLSTRACLTAASAGELKPFLAEERVAIVLVDRKLPESDCHHLLEQPDGVSLATFGTPAVHSYALAEIESSASYQLRHPFSQLDLERLLAHLSTGLSERRYRGRPYLYRGLVGNSTAIRELRTLVQRIAPSKSTVLITGETGTGKEIVARNLHYRSGQGAGPFVPVNCAAIPSELLESELFGHRKGAFTGALADREGRFSMAGGGTLFLNEIGDMPLGLQARLLRALEERIIYRMGCDEPNAMTARLVAATHYDLEQRVADGTFREDLYYQLCVVPIRVPALRDRKEDIPLLIEELSFRVKREQGVMIELTPAAVESLRSYDWPGNVRELANFVERMAAICPSGIADMADIPNRYRSVPALHVAIETGAQTIQRSPSPQIQTDIGIDLREVLRSTEAALIRQALDLCDGTMTQAASLLHVGRTTLAEKVKRLRLSDHLKTAR